MDDASAQLLAVALAATWCGFGLYGIMRKIERSPQVREMLHRFRRARLSTKAAVIAGLIAVIAVGGTKPGDSGGGDPPRGLPPPAAPAVVEPAVAPVEVRTNGVALTSESASAVEVADWRKHGSSSGGVWLDYDEPFFRIGTNDVSRVHVSASGVLSFESMRRPPVGAPLPDGSGLPALAPLLAPLGMVPEANWTNAGAASRFWHDAAPGRGRVFTWENALLDRLPGRRVSVQAELRPSGDFTIRYDFKDLLDPPATNAVLGAQVGTNGVNALAILGTNLLAETVWRVDGVRVTNGVSVADLLCTNGILRTPARFAIEWKNTSGIDPNADTDGDGLSDWDEVFRHGTDPNRADTDGDGLSDAAEHLTGANPLDADEDGDGVPDGTDSAAWAANPLWGDVAGETNLVVTLVSDIPSGETATLVFGSLALPLRHARSYSLCLQPAQMLETRLFSTCARNVPLRIETGEAHRSRDPIRSSPPPVPAFSPAPLWSDDPDEVFDGKARKGHGRLARPVLELVENPGVPGECIHHDLVPSKTWTVSVLPSATGLGIDDLMLGGFERNGADTISLSVGFTPGETASGTVSLTLPKLRIGELSECRSIHRCIGFWSGPRCSACGRFHRPGHACSHAPDCAAVLDPSADCTCDGIYVHVAWQDFDGNGVEDRNDVCLVPGADGVSFTGLDGDEDGCCCWHDYAIDLPANVRLLSHSSNLRVFDASGDLMSPGSTSTVFTIQAKAPSLCVQGSEVVYELTGPTNNSLRTIRVPVTAWDIYDTGLSFNWATNTHSADAINLRRDYGTPIDYAQPEWTKGTNHASRSVRDESACWIAGTHPSVMARFAILPSDISNAVLNAACTGTILSAIGDTAISFSNGVTHSTGPHPDHASFLLQSAVPTVVSRSTNEVWHWYAKSLDGHSFVSPVSIATNGPGVAYSILDEPQFPWTDSAITNQNVWVSVLDFLTPTNVCGDATDKTNALAMITDYLFSGFDLHYDVEWGGSRYVKGIPGRHPDEYFFLSGYMRKTNGTTVNCYDQAGSLAAFGRSVGVEAEILHMDPFGYILETYLIGRGPCNNPFYANPVYHFNASPVCPTNAPDRSGFGNHRFVQFGTHIFDACAGPVCGGWTFDEYKLNVIDMVTTNTLYTTGTNAAPYMKIKEVR